MAAPGHPSLDTAAVACPLRVLLISRTYPPVVGGMERYSYHLATELSRLVQQTSLVNTRGKRALPLFLPYSLAAGLALIRRQEPDVIHLCDAALAPIGLALKQLSGRPVTISVHGLDVTYRNRVYQGVVGRALAGLDRFIAVSRSTAGIIAERWPRLAARTTVVPNGVEPPPPGPPPRPSAVLTEQLRGRRFILTAGRLVKRKGVAWFVANVLPALPEDVLYVVAGDGPERAAIAAAASGAGQTRRVLLLGRVADADIEWLYRHAEAFAMPNIAVPNDVEGFGLVALEAAVRGLPVVASGLQGIPEAVNHGMNGYLVAAGDPQAWTARLVELLSLPLASREGIGARFEAYTLQHYSWQRVAAAYAAELARVVEARTAPGSAA